MYDETTWILAAKMAHGTREEAYKKLEAFVWHLQKVQKLPLRQIKKIAFAIKIQIAWYYEHQDIMTSGHQEEK